MKWVSFCDKKYINVDRFNINFNEDRFIDAYLQKNNKCLMRNKFVETKVKIQNNLKPELFKRLRGHDLAELLNFIVRKLRRERVFKDSDQLEGCLMASVESHDIEVYPLFKALGQNARLEN